jgi:8-oxo-dGTP diphosphatase
MDAPLNLTEATSVDQVDWVNWEPYWRATLLFVVRNGSILLIHKKRGFGAGKINGPGGRLEHKETPMQAAVRETQEELLVTPLEVKPAGDLFFQFRDGLNIRGWVFRAEDCEGTPQETEEAVPLWAPLDEIPYEHMWEDDRYWLPLVLERTSFSGRFLFDGETMIDHRITTAGSA